MKGIVDIEELALEVRDKNSRIYISEAISAYKSGAYRSSIISIWISVIYDIISKMRELADANDKLAKQEIKKLDKLIKDAKTDNSVIKQLQDLERNYLKLAFEDFDFINKTEFILLERIKEDRNLCAHPAFIESGLLFQPNSELVKSHLLHSINFLLKHKPVQGKAALDEIFNDLKRLSFPKNEIDARSFLKTKYFDYAKPVLIDNLTKSLITGLLNGSVKSGNEKINVTNTLSIIADLFQTQFENILKRKLPKLLNDIEDANLWNVIIYLSNNQKYWSYLDKSSKLRLKEFLNSKADNQIEIYNNFSFIDKIEIPEIEKEIDNLKSFVNVKVEKAIEVYGNSGSFASAASNGKSEILPLVSFFKQDNVISFIKVVVENRHDQILPAAESEDIIEAVYDATKHIVPIEEWEPLVTRFKDFDLKYMGLTDKIEKRKNR